MGKPQAAHIKRIAINNYRRIKTIEAEFSGTGVVTIAGQNEQGKSTFIDAIQSVFANRKIDAPQPIRTGEERAEVIAETDTGLILRRVWTNGDKKANTKIEVTNADGAAYKSPQKMLDELTNAIAFDLHEFARMDPRKQADTLRDLIGVDTRKLDDARQRAYDNRRDVGRDVRSLQSQLKAAPHHDDVGSPVTVSALVSQLDEIQQHNAALDQLKRDRNDSEEKRKKAETDAEAVENRMKRIDEEIARLQAEKDEQRELHAKITRAEKDRYARVKELDRKIDEFDLKDDSAIRDQIDRAEGTNAEVARKQADNTQHDKIKAELDKVSAQYDRYDAEIAEIDAENQKMLDEANFPVEGLGFSEDGAGVTMHGFPLSQCSSAQLLEISASIVVAMNPGLKVIVIRDASLMDKNHLDVIERLADEKGFQVFLEIVSDTPGGSTLFIEDGELVTAEN